jgi:hypothetical protein
MWFVRVARGTFAAEGGSPHTYTEIGFAHGGQLSQPICFPGYILVTPIAMLAGQQLRIIYEIFVTYTPGAPRSKTASITGWPVAPSVNTDGGEAIETFSWSEQWPVHRPDHGGQLYQHVNGLGSSQLRSGTGEQQVRVVLSTTSLALSAAPVH